MIVDAVSITAISGSGGQGSSTQMSLSARRVIGGGGDGGKGGSVYVRVDPHAYDLSKLRGQRVFRAPDGQSGQSNNKKGRDGQDIEILVPMGTIIRDADGTILTELVSLNSGYLLCQGGHPGQGNYKKTYTLPPGPGEEKEITLDYRIVHDVSIVGFANSGKTSLFNALTGKDYKVAAYPFTTTSCVWAPVEFQYRRFVLMDTPPLKSQIEGEKAHGFLKHLYRSRIILLVSDHDGTGAEYKQLINLISQYDSRLLAYKKIFYLRTKVDTIKILPGDESIVPVSVQADQGLDRLKQKIASELSADSVGESGI